MSARVLYLTVGLPGVGKTTLAKQLAERHAILRLTPDDWMAPLFGDSDADGRRDILEGRMIWVAHEALRSTSVVLDFGCWSPKERYAIRAIAESVGARFELCFVELDETERRARAGKRWETSPETTFEMTEADHARFLAHFQPPTREELTASQLPPPPPGFDTWPHWAAERWPTLSRFDQPVDALVP